MAMVIRVRFKRAAKIIRLSTPTGWICTTA